MFFTFFFALLKPVNAQESILTSEQILTQTNQLRAQKNLPPLVENPLLDNAAKAKAKDMLAQDYWNHINPQGKTPWQFVREAGYEYQTAGENLALNYMSAESVIAAWRNSPTHNLNQMNPSYSQIGISVERGQLKGKETYLIVAEYASPKSVTTN